VYNFQDNRLRPDLASYLLDYEYMENVPFFANTPDGTHCVQASFRIILKYFLPEHDFSYEQLDAMSQKQPGKGTWWPALLLKLSKLGIEVIDIEPFDYERFYKEGEAYVRSFYPEGVAKYHLKSTNLNDIKSLIPEFLQKVDIQSRPAKTDDIERLLNDGWLVAAALNSRTLNDRPGFSGHVVVVYKADKHSGQLWLHDPGLPPHQNLLVTRQKFEEAFYYAGQGNAAIVGLKQAAN